ncbi:hypothetical protein A1D29_10010 [Pasteurellaceae bacterium Orientalotternb1]|nr:hypothetical protein A1D29_10010 [Pasteurellaceae bacterium Orientalotternb1]
MSFKKITLASLILLSLTACSSGGGSNQHQPKPTPKPEVQPQPQPNPTPDVQPQPSPTPDVQPQPQPSPKPDVQPSPKPDVQPQPQPNPKPDVQPQPQPNPKPDVQPQPQPNPKPDVQPQPQPDPKPEVQPQPQPNPKPDVQPKPEKDLEKERQEKQKKIDDAKGIISSEYKPGFNELNETALKETKEICFQGTCQTWSGISYEGSNLYNQTYSVVKGHYSGRSGTLDGVEIREHSFAPTIAGLRTDIDAIPTEGKATYNGRAFNGNSLNDFTYTVDFGERTGSGKVKGIGSEFILEKARIENARLVGGVSIKNLPRGAYSLGFFGPKAEELAGQMLVDKDDGKKEGFGLAASQEKINQ